MYKILIKYTSKLKDVYWKNYTVIDKNEEIVEFSADNFEDLRTEIDKLAKKYGYENIRVINDVTYDVSVTLYDDIENVELSTSEDIEDIFNTAFANVFGE